MLVAVLTGDELIIFGMTLEQKHIQVRVSRSAFGENIRVLREMMAPARVCVVMKSNAYGHGLAPLLPAAVAAGADCIGVCTNEEAATVRRIHPSQPLMRLRMALADELDESVANFDMEEIVGSLAAAEYLASLGRRRGRPVEVHIKLDTGMGRTGFLAGELEQLKRALTVDGLRVCGVMTHLASADGPSLDSAREQLAEFSGCIEHLTDLLPEDVLLHTHNSAASIRLPELRGGMVRMGAACYGVRTSRHFANPPVLKPVMSIKTRVMEVRSVPPGRTIGYGGLFRTERPTRIATLPVGFGEGYPRALFNKGIVLINGQRCPVVGRVSLNVTTVDISDIEGKVSWGDEAVLVGTQGAEEMTFEALADLYDSVHTDIHLMAGNYNSVQYVD